MSTPVKLWHDDIRRPPDETWTWARTNQEAQRILLEGNVVECSLDHDLGLHNHDPDVPDADLQQGWDTENDGVTLVKWMLTEVRTLPWKITIHSWNPVGAERMRALLADAGHPVAVRPYLRRSV